MIYKSYRYRLSPTEEQKRMLAQQFGAVRFVYNWALETKEQAWKESKERLSRMDLSIILTNKRKELSWLNEIPRSPLTYALIRLDRAYEAFFNEIGGRPRFKSKRDNRESFTFQQDPRYACCLRFDTGGIAVPKVGFIKGLISRPFAGKLKTATILKVPSGKYFVVCQVEEGTIPVVISEPIESDAIGVDLGIKDFATLSTGEKIANPQYLDKSLKHLRRLSRQHDKKKKGSQNRNKSRLRLARLHEKVANQRKDFLHKTSTKLIRENQTICIESLNVSGLSKLRSLARRVQDAGWGEFRHQLTYKAEWYGKNVLAIDRFAPSSKQCSCGHKNEYLTLKQRTWTCVQCNTTHDRDLLAANNIVKFAFHPELAVKNLVGRGTPEFTPVETLAIAGL